MSFDIQKRYIFNRRVFFIMSIKITFFFVLIFRLGFLQIFSNKKYSTLARLNGLKLNFTMPKRGAILDRNGKTIADSVKGKFIVFDGAKLNSEGMNSIKEVYNIIYDNDQEMVARAIKKVLKIAQNNPYEDLILYKNLSQEKTDKILFNIPLLKNISIKKEYVRHYKYDKIFGHVIGYVTGASKNMIDKAQNSITKKLYRYTNYFIGSSDIEFAEESWLSGKYGVNTINTDIRGNIVDRKTAFEPIDGNNIKLTLDADIQTKAAELFGEQKGGVVMMDIQTGEIVSMYSSPSFDPNLFLQQDSSNILTQMLYFDESRPFFNRCLSGLYAPGSTFKSVIGLSAINNGWNPNETVKCRGKIKIGNREYHCWKKEGHGTVDLHHAIAQSCNIYFYTLGINSDIDNIYKDALELGYDTVYDLGFGKNLKGCIPNRKWKMQTIGESWYGGDTVNTAIGQGYTQSNLLQMTVAMSRLASGTGVIPNIWKDFIRVNDLNVSHKNNIDKRIFADLKFNKEDLDYIRNALYAAVNTESGSLFNLSKPYRDMEICGKTGTAQIVSKRFEADEMRRNKKIAANGVFSAYAPYDNPKYAISVLVQEGVWGSVSAFPIAAKMLEFAMKGK